MPRIGNIYCIGRNYAEHAKELGNAVPKEPVVFLKPSTAYLDQPREWRLPAGVGRVDFEVELVVCIGRDFEGALSADQALNLVDSYAVGIDFTARELQNDAKQKGLPWLAAKGRKHFAPVSAFLPSSRAGAGPFGLELSINGQVRQKASTSEMLFSTVQLLQHLAEVYGLRQGDLLFTGTPSGVGPVKAGDTLQAVLTTRAERVALELIIRSE